MYSNCICGSRSGCGNRLILISRKHRKLLKKLAEKTGRKVIAIKTDCTDKEQVDAMVEQVVAELGGLDFCHNNAGICIKLRQKR